MSYIQPTGVIQLFKGIALDNRYMHTIYFGSEALQDAWFTNKYNTGSIATPKKAFGFTAQSYSRPSRQSVKIKINVEEILGVTYMRFKNRNGMWFYAFINYVEYVNENTTLVTYEIDVIQSWFIQKGVLNPCMILREHVSNDTFGEHLEAEPVGSDVYDQDPITCSDMDTDFDGVWDGTQYVPYMAVVQTSADGQNPPNNYAVQDPIVHGIYTPTFYFYQLLSGDYTDGGIKELYDTLYDCLGGWDTDERKADIFSIIQFPSHFIHNPEETYAIQHPNNLHGYVPQNKKLYGYPYSYLLISNCDGTTAEYRWEYFDGDVTDQHDINFKLEANELGAGCIVLYPTLYNRVPNNFDAKIVMDNFPKCSFAYDGYQAWVASGGKTKTEYQGYVAEQRGAYAKESLAAGTTLEIIDQSITFGTDIARLAGAESKGEALRSGASALHDAVRIGQTAVNAVMQGKEIDLSLDEAQHKKEFAFKDARYTPNTVVGSQSPTIAAGYGHLRFKFFNVHVRKEELVKIDDFLTVYGYSINKVDTPQIHNRPYWNFIQTKGCNITGDIPSSSLAAINAIFDGGIFFWNNGDNIGNFEIGGRNTYGALINKT